MSRITSVFNHFGSLVHIPLSFVAQIARVAVMDLFKQKRKWNWSELHMKWQQRIPTEIEVKREWLHGIALSSSNKDEYQLLNEMNLSLNLSKRIKQLFMCESRFTIQQLTPYLERFLIATGKTIDNLICTYTKTHNDQETDTTYFTKKE